MVDEAEILTTLTRVNGSPTAMSDIMGHTPEAVHALHLQIQGLEDELSVLKRQLAKAEAVDISQASRPVSPSTAVLTDAEIPPEQPIAAKDEDSDSRWPLDADEYRRYGRQMIMPEIGLEGSLPAFKPRDEQR